MSAPPPHDAVEHVEGRHSVRPRRITSAQLVDSGVRYIVHDCKHAGQTLDSGSIDVCCVPHVVLALPVGPETGPPIAWKNSTTAILPGCCAICP
jgi:hypothetical protein